MNNTVETEGTEDNHQQTQRVEARKRNRSSVRQGYLHLSLLLYSRDQMALQHMGIPSVLPVEKTRAPFNETAVRERCNMF
jgi:hypothetical protein